MSKAELPTLKVQVDEQYLERMKEFWNSIEELIQLPAGEGEDLPRWVQVIHKHLNETIYFHLDLLKSGTSDAYRMGLSIGAMKKMVHVLNENVERLDKVKIEIQVPSHLKEQFEEIGRRINELILPEDDIRGLKILGYGYLITAFENWEWPKAREFFRGVTDGLGTIKTTENNWVRARHNTEILIFLLWNWNAVETQIKSVHHLHSWLGRYFNRNQLGEYKRVEKICERIRLSFGPAGRPKSISTPVKKKIPTKRE